MLSPYSDNIVSTSNWRGNTWRRRAASRLILLQMGAVFPILQRIAAIVIIQRMIRGFLTRARLRSGLRRPARRSAARIVETSIALQRDIDWIAALTIQRAWKKYVYKRYHVYLRHLFSPFYLSKEDLAAAVIQRTWDRFACRAVFAHLRTAIVRLEGGDAKEAMAYLGDSERWTVELASQIHVRFRLAGHWPPCIYYKVMTHGSVCDINAASPKDYAYDRMLPAIDPHRRSSKPLFSATHKGAGAGAKAATKDPSAPPVVPWRSTEAALQPKAATRRPLSDRRLHNASPSLSSTSAVAVSALGGVTTGVPVPPTDFTRWYQRLDNNPWKQVPPRCPLFRDLPLRFSSVLHPQFLPAKPPLPGPTSKARADARRIAKRKLQRQWLVSAFASAAAMTPAISSAALQSLGIEQGDRPRVSATSAIADLLHKLPDSALQPSEVAGLVDWADHLSFEAYDSSWDHLGSTAATRGHAYLRQVDHTTGAFTLPSLS